MVKYNLKSSKSHLKNGCPQKVHTRKQFSVMKSCTVNCMIRILKTKLESWIFFPQKLVKMRMVMLTDPSKAPYSKNPKNQSLKKNQRSQLKPCRRLKKQANLLCFCK